MTLPRFIFDRNPLCEEVKRGCAPEPRFEAFTFAHGALHKGESQ